MIPFLFEKTAAGPPPCPACGKKVPAGTTKCPACRTDIRPTAPLAPNDDRQEGGTGPPTGSEASVQLETERDWAKYSSALVNPSLLKSALGGAAVVGAGVVAAKGLPMMRQVTESDRKRQLGELEAQGKLPPGMAKSAQRTGANPILRLRQAVKRLRKAAGDRASVAFAKK